MTNWNKRLTELRAKYGEKPLTNKELFESKEYRDFTQKAAEDNRGKMQGCSVDG